MSVYVYTIVYMILIQGVNLFNSFVPVRHVLYKCLLLGYTESYSVAYNTGIR